HAALGVLHCGEALGGENISTKARFVSNHLGQSPPPWSLRPYRVDGSLTAQSEEPIIRAAQWERWGSLVGKEDASTSTLRRKEMESERNVGLLHGLAPGKLSELCLMHLTRLLDLDGEKFQAFAFNKNVKRCSLISPFKKKEKRDSDGISTENVSLIYRLISFLRKPEILKEVGLFRKTGNICRQRQLKEWLAAHPEELTNPVNFTAHDCANVLKSTLAELPQPLLTGRHFEAYRQASEFPEKGLADAEQRQLKVMQLLMLLLPRENAVLVELLMSLLHQVASEPNNKMTATALATMFAPHMMCCRKAEAEELRKDAAIATKAVTFMIEHSQELFKIPADLSLDVARCIQSIKEQSEDGQLTPLKEKKDEDVSPVRTVISYAHNPSNGESGPQTDTQMALAELCAHVQSMPECARKKKLLKQFNQVNLTPKTKGKHSRSKTLSSSIKAIDIEEQSTDKATIITCGNALSAADTNLCKKLSYDCEDDVQPTPATSSKGSLGQNDKCRRRRRHSNEEAECTPPKVECMGKENIACQTLKEDKKGQERVKGQKEKKGRSPLPSSENEISYLQVEMRQNKFPLTTRQMALVSPVRHRA
ncbi:hypothetical protein BaRGS_00025533, partial [Batillaria attramentaria]